MGKSPKPRAKKPKTSSVSDDVEESPSSQRRSCRGSTSRTVSYADADLSEEDMFEDADLMEAVRRSKAEAKKKQRTNDLWSKFKVDVADTKTKAKETLIVSEDEEEEKSL